MKSEYDIVVIGSGIGGLSSAALLLNLGKKILIIEKEPKPGGYLTEFKNNGFTFDVSLHLLNGCDEGGYIYEIFRKCGIVDQIKFIKPKYLYRSVFPDFDLRVPQADTEGYKELLIEKFPESKGGIDSFFREISDVYRALDEYASRKKNLSSSFFPYLRVNFESVINKHIRDKKLKTIICQLWIYFGLPPSMLRAVDFCYPWFDYVNNGGFYVENGSYAIVKALVNQINNKGGDFLYNKNVGRIILENGLCRRVAFGQEEISCNTLISNIDLTRTIYELIGIQAFSTNVLDKLKAVEPSISAFEVFLGLDVDLSKIYPDDYEIFVNPSYDIEEQYRASLNNNIKKAPFVITINSNVNKSSAPVGKSVVTIIMLVGYNYWISKSRDEYQDKKQRIANILIERASKIMPELNSHIQKTIISTPVTFERYTNNLRGAIYGYAQTKYGKAEIRPNEANKIKNLYFASAWARQGSGVAKVLRSAEDVFRKMQSEKRTKVTV